MLLVKLSKRYFKDSCHRNDLIQEGWIAILERVGSMSHLAEDQQLAYAVPFIRKAMLIYSIKNRRIVGFAKTKDDYKAICNLTSLMEGKTRMQESDAIAFSRKLNVRIESVKMAYECLYEDDHTFEHEHCDDNTITRVSNVIDLVSALANRKNENALKLEAVYMATNDLNEDQRKIVNRRWLCDTQETFRSIASDSGLSISGVAFLEAKALTTIKLKVAGFY